MVDSNRDEIAKLEALYAANPEGRVFTHLAEAYRKAGRLDDARRTLEDGLTRHGDYPSAHVVLGRVLLDAGDGDAATHAFRRVLELDRHNLIALRALGELARDRRRSAEALHYYQELRALDPGNDELARIVRELHDQAESEGAEAPIGEAWSEGAVESAFTDDDGPDAEIELEEVAADEPASDEPDDLAASAPDETALGWGEVQLTDEVEIDEPPEPEDDEDVSYGLMAGPLDGLSLVPETDEDSGAGAEGPQAPDAGDWVPQDRWDTFADPAATEAEPRAAQADWAREPAGEPVGESDADVATEAEPEEALRDEAPAVAESEGGDWPEIVPGGDEDAVLLEVESVETTRIEVELDPETASAIVAENLPDLDEESGAGFRAPAEVVTETMAEVYAAQGLTERAVEVYRQLQALRPDDSRIAGRLAELEQMIDVHETPAPGEPAEDREAWLERVESAWTGGEGAVGADDDTLYGWRPEVDEGGQAEAVPVRTYFRSLLAWRPDGYSSEASEPGDEPPQAEGTEAEDELLLIDEIEPVAEGAGTAEAAFDEWFGPEPGAGGEASPRAEGGESQGTETEEDLEMFRTWLQSLKK